MRRDKNHGFIGVGYEEINPTSLPFCLCKSVHGEDLFSSSRSSQATPQEAAKFIYNLLVHQLLFFPDEEEHRDKELSNFETALGIKLGEPIFNMSQSHQIDYSQTLVKSFLTLLNNCLSDVDNIKKGVEQSIFEQIWCQLAHKDLATIYLTVLMGKLVLMEKNAIERKNSDSEDLQNNSEESIAIMKVVEQLKLGTQKFDPNHALIFKRNESIKSRTKRTAIEPDEEVIAKEPISAAAANISNSPSFLYERQWFSNDQIVERSAIMNSIIYVSLFYRFDPQDASLISLIDTWNKLRQQAVQGSLQIDHLAEEIRENLCPPREALFKYIHFCNDYEVMGENDLTLPPPLNKYDPLTLAAAYVYPRLQTVCRTSRLAVNVIDDITSLVYQPINLQEPERMKNILNFFRLIITQLYLDSDDKLKAFMKSLQPFFMQPIPVGGMIMDTLKICKKELIFRGSHVRQRFERTIRRVKQKDGNIVEKRRVVHILFNSCASNAKNLVDKFDLHAELNDDEILMAKANLMLNMFDLIDKKSSDELMKVPIEVLSEYYRKIAILMDKVEEMGEGGVSSKMNEFMQLKNEMIAVAKESISTRFITPQTRAKSPKMPEVAFNLVNLVKEDNISNAKREYKIYPRTKMLDTIKELVDSLKEETPDGEQYVLDVAVAGGSGTLQRFVHTVELGNKLKILTGVTLNVYLIPLGENNYLSNWLEKYDGWYSRHLHYPVLSPIPIVPQLKTKNTEKELEKYKSQNDKKGAKRSGTLVANSSSSGSSNNLRRSTVMTVAAVPIKLGKRTESVNITDYRAPKKFLTPHRFMRTLLSDYFTDAVSVVPTYVYNVQCLTNEIESVANPQDSKVMQVQKSRKVNSYLSFAFCQRLEIGILAEALLYQTNEKIDAATLEELQANKNFKYNGTQVVISYVPMDPTGERTRTSEISEPAKTYSSICIKNCGSFGDRGELIAPCQPWLEVYAEESQAGTKKKKKESATTYHVSSINIDSATHQMFAIVLDGELFGPFHKIIINSASNTIQLHTFNEPVIY